MHPKENLSVFDKLFGFFLTALNSAAAFPDFLSDENSSKIKSCISCRETVSMSETITE